MNLVCARVGGKVRAGVIVGEDVALRRDGCGDLVSLIEGGPDAMRNRVVAADLAGTSSLEMD